MNPQNCTVKDMLNNGFSPEQMLNNLQREIAEAQAQIDAEKKAAEAATKAKREEALIEARINIADALIDYIEALEIFPVEVMDETTTEDVVELLKELEDQIKAYAKMINILGDLKKEQKKSTIVHPEMSIDDKIIYDFLKSLE